MNNIQKPYISSVHSPSASSVLRAGYDAIFEARGARRFEFTHDFLERTPEAAVWEFKTSYGRDVLVRMNLAIHGDSENSYKIMADITHCEANEELLGEDLNRAVQGLIEHANQTIRFGRLHIDCPVTPAVRDALHARMQHTDRDSYTRSKFSLEDMNAIKSYSGRVKYCKQFLQQLGKGSARVVFDLGDDKVLKLALNPKGNAQNYVEYSVSKSDWYNSILANVIDCDDDQNYLICEKARKIAAAEFKQKIGIPFRTFAENIHNADLARRGIGKYTVPSYIEDNEFYHEIVEMAGNFDMPMGDFTRIDSFGERGGDVVVRDYGLDSNVHRQHYNRGVR